MAVASFCAALIHSAVMPAHFSQSVWYGSFFLVTALTQLAFAVAILIRPSRQLVLAGVLGALTVVALWILSRVAGVPIGPDRGATEPFGILDSLASLGEAAAATFGILVLRAKIPRPSWRWSSWPIGLRCAAPACIVGTVVASVVSTRS